MKIPHDKFCVLPWVSIEASPIGTVRPCCLAENEIVDDCGEKFNLRNAELIKVQQSQYMQQLRQQFLQKKQPDTCRKCWNEEKSGRTSKRMHTLDRLKHIVTDTEWTADAKPLIFLDLKLGNVCNLKCRICGSWSSSQYAAEEIKWSRREEQKHTFAYQMLQAGSWPRESDSFWQQIDRHIDNIRYIEFTGGEPFLIQEHFDMLQGIIDKGIADQVEIHYNTNGTIFPESGPDIWQHFKTVEIAVSIDDIKERFEYQRTNAGWADVLKNIERFKQLRSSMPNIRLQCCITVNLFNIRYLKDVADWANQQRFNFVYWNIMHDAWYFSIASLPTFAKLELSAYLKNCNPPANFKKDFDLINNFMSNGISTDGDEIYKKITEVDIRRQQCFSTTFPEMAAILKFKD
jgi:MoaA/NifB/PqqE/SkfB family radical SAM enzyme